MQLPTSLLNALQTVNGFDEQTFIKVHESGEQVTSIRINPGKINMLMPLAGSIFNDQLESVKWSEHGYYLPQRPSFTMDPLFHAGAYYVQEASSMFLEEVLKQTVDLSRPLRVLDVCAAPGGKSTLIQSIISSGSLLISNEVIKARVSILSENISKWGSANVIVTNNDSCNFERLPDYFDVIVVDAPCSGSGLFRKDPSAIDEWSEQHVRLCSQRQQRILADILSSLKTGGVLIYSTCSYSTEEDEAIADWLTGNFPLSTLECKTEKEWNIVETRSEQQHAYGYRFYPDKLKGEGFFIAAFRKEDQGKNDHVNKVHLQKKSKIITNRVSENDIECIRPFLKDAARFFFTRQNDEILAIPVEFENDLTVLQSALYIKKAGINMGSIIRNKLNPHHELSVSTIISESVKRMEVDQATALDYLRRSVLKIESGENGWHLITHAQLPLGWVKIIPGRINNYYPANWRILNK